MATRYENMQPDLLQKLCAEVRTIFYSLQSCSGLLIYFQSSNRRDILCTWHRLFAGLWREPDVRSCAHIRASTSRYPPTTPSGNPTYIPKHLSATNSSPAHLSTSTVATMLIKSATPEPPPLPAC